MEKINISLKDSCIIEASCYLLPKDNYSKDELEPLLDKYCCLTKLLFSKEQDIKQEHYNHAFCVDLLLIIYNNQFSNLNISENIVAASSFRIFLCSNDNNILYINAALVHPCLQGKGIAQGMIRSVILNYNKLFIHQHYPSNINWISGRSQNICFAKTMKRIFGNIYPIDNNELTNNELDNIYNIGKDIAIQLGMNISYNNETIQRNEYGYNTMLCKQIYFGCPLMKEIPILKDSKFNSLLNINEGDALLLLSKNTLQ